MTESGCIGTTQGWKLPRLRAVDLLPKLHSVCGVIVFGRNEARCEALTAVINAFVDEKEPLERWGDIPRFNGGFTPSFAQ
jgi:hypothetical protein